jgi:hypothetical protein
MGGYFTSDSEKWTINYAAFRSGLSTFNPRTRPHRDTFFPDSGTEKRSGPACPPGVQHVALIIPIVHDEIFTAEWKKSFPYRAEGSLHK